MSPVDNNNEESNDMSFMDKIKKQTKKETEAVKAANRSSDTTVIWEGDFYTVVVDQWEAYTNKKGTEIAAGATAKLHHEKGNELGVNFKGTITGVALATLIDEDADCCEEAISTLLGIAHMNKRAKGLKYTTAKQIASLMK